MTRIIDREHSWQRNARGVKGAERSPAERTHAHPAGQPGMNEARKGKEKTKR